jgi:hypothetical protein
VGPHGFVHPVVVCVFLPLFECARASLARCSRIFSSLQMEMVEFAPTSFISLTRKTARTTQREDQRLGATSVSHNHRDERFPGHDIQRCNGCMGSILPQPGLSGQAPCPPLHPLHPMLLDGVHWIPNLTLFSSPAVPHKVLRVPTPLHGFTNDYRDMGMPRSTPPSILTACERA